MSGYLLHLLRHGAPDTPGLMLGHRDISSSKAGVAACVEQAEGLEVEALVASDLIRARRPGEMLAALSGRPLTLDSRWRELDFGAWDGHAIAAIDQDALSRFWTDPDGSPPPGGERWSQLTARVGSAIADLAPRTTLIVTHGGAMRAALAVLCGFDQRQIWAFDLPYASLLTLYVWPGETAQIVGLSQ